VKVLVLGASGFLGSHVYHKLMKENNLSKEIVGTSYLSSTENLEAININNKEQFEEFYKKRNPDFVIWTLMSSNNEHSLIHKGLRNLLDVINEQTLLIYVSTDGIFSDGKGHFSEDAEPAYLNQQNPMSTYTNAKLDGEIMIQQEHKNHIIIRTGPLYGQDLQGKWDPRVSALQTALEANKTYTRADNIFKTFVHVEDLANAIIELLTNDYRGNLHVGPKMKESYYTFNFKIATKLEMNNSLVLSDKVSMEEVRERGVLLDTSLNTAKCNSMLKTRFRDV
jgi:dTDP-4-dehydrorhamnose reductase